MDIEKLIQAIEGLLRSLPKPLIEPVWYPGIPNYEQDQGRTWESFRELMKELFEFLIRFLNSEGFFDENPMVHVYADFKNATGVIVYYKGEKVFEKWIASFEIGDKAQRSEGQRPHAQSPYDQSPQSPEWYRDVYGTPYTMDPRMDADMDPYDYEMDFDPYGRRIR